MSATSHQKDLPGPSSKAGAVAPQVTPEEVELSHVQNGKPPENMRLEDDIMQCARIGALEHIQAMFQTGKYNAKYKDAEDITPLHWAAINNQYAVCQYLLEQGADVNAKGGESNATAAMWAAQRSHLYIVNLLLQNGADLLLTDGQGYNILHLATIDGNALLLILLLHQNIPVDTPDPQGHTSLMWAGYKGWPACVDLLLRWGANVNATDDNGYTPLHWALVKGSRPCLEKLIEFGADRFAKTNEGKTPATCAEEMNSRPAYHRALADHGYGPDGNAKVLPLNLAPILRDKNIMAKFFFLYPVFMLFVILYIASQFSIYVSLPTILVVGFGLQWIAQKLASQGPLEYHVMHRTPYLAGVFAGTLFWVGVGYITAVLPYTFRSYPVSNIFFVLAYASTTYFFFLSMLEDPGLVPKPASRNQQRAVIEELFSLWKFDEDTFCVHCMIRKPLRSKHCRRCGRCVAKHDHHCPWVDNCVANNNIRHFFLYILSLEVGIILFIRLALAYLDSLPAPSDTTCHILSPALCSFALRDTWTVALSIWTFLQLTWVTMLLIVQSVQIAKNQTTFENMKRHTESHDRPLHHPITRGTSHAATSLNETAAASTRLQPAPRRPDSCLTRWKKLLGLDTFLATASDASTGKIQNRGNPFSRGVIGNCRDFWCDPAPFFRRRKTAQGYLGGEVVDYAAMYDVPLRLRRSRRGRRNPASARDGMAYTRVAGQERDGELSNDEEEETDDV